MAAIVVRLGLLAVGLSLGQIGLDSLTRGEAVAVVQLSLALIALVGGSAGFVVPLLDGGRKEASRG